MGALLAPAPIAERGAESPDRRDGACALPLLRLARDGDASSVAYAAPLFDHLTRRCDRTPAEQNRFEAALRILDHAATEICFGSGAYPATNRQRPEERRRIPAEGVRQRFLKEMGPAIESLARVMQSSTPAAIGIESGTILANINNDPYVNFIEGWLRGATKI